MLLEPGDCLDSGPRQSPLMEQSFLGRAAAVVKRANNSWTEFSLGDVRGRTWQFSIELGSPATLSALPGAWLLVGVTKTLRFSLNISGYNKKNPAPF